MAADPQAVAKFRATLDVWLSSGGDEIWGPVEGVVEKLLAAGWKYPSDVTCNRCGCLVGQHNAGGCARCRECSLPHGGR